MSVSVEQGISQRAAVFHNKLGAQIVPYSGSLSCPGSQLVRKQTGPIYILAKAKLQLIMTDGLKKENKYIMCIMPQSLVRGTHSYLKTSLEGQIQKPVTTRIVTEKRTEWQGKSNKGNFFVLVTKIKENMLLGHILNDRKMLPGQRVHKH